MRLWKAVLAWLAILVLAIANGALRETVLVPAFGPVTGLVASGVLLALAIFLVTFACARWLGLDSEHEAWRVGLLWLALTLLFEFAFGALVQHRTVQEMMEAYTLKRGNLWPLDLVATLVAPVAAWHLLLARRRR